MSTYEYKITKPRYGGTLIVRRENHAKVEQWSSGRKEWYHHPDAMGAFVGFTDHIWDDISEAEALAVIAEYTQ